MANCKEKNCCNLLGNIDILYLGADDWYLGGKINKMLGRALYGSFFDAYDGL